MTEYEKDLNELKEQILKEGNVLVSKRDLLERFCEIDKEYNGEPWNLLQILSNINVLIGEEPCEKAVGVQDCINAIENTDCELSPQAWKEITISIMSLPPVTPAHKRGKWIFSKTIFDKHGCTAECPSCHKKWKTYDEIRWRKENKFCLNCGAEMGSEE